MSIKIPENEYMRAGKEAHKIIQAHCLGKKKDDRLTDFDWHFTSQEQNFTYRYNDEFNIHGYVDLVAYDSKVICEIKTSSKPWGQQQFEDSQQWRLYSLVTGFKKILLVTCKPDLSSLKTYYREVNDNDLEQVKHWIEEGIKIIKRGEFKTDLVDGHCVNYRCPYSSACFFRQNG